MSLADLLSILAALSVAGIWSGHAAASAVEVATYVTALMGMFGAVWLIISRRLGANSVPPSRNLSLSLRRTIESWAATWGIAGLLSVSTIANAEFSIWVALVAGLAILTLTRFAMSFSQLGVASDRPRAVVIGACASARALTSTRDAQETVELVGFVPFTSEDASSMPHLPELASLPNLADTLRYHDVDVAFVSPSDQAVTGEVHQVIDTCEKLGLQTQYFPSFLDVENMRVGLTWSANRPGLNVHAVGENSLALIGKRALDILGATIGIAALLPVFIACALAVKLTSRGPVFFKQTRTGKNGRTFGCLKFRTMRVGAHAQQELLRAASLQDGPAFKIKGDPRITPVGRILRKFSIDELPQLFNVLLGDMSLVGPRPPIPSEVDKYTWWQRRRISIKPGLTCVWQVYGRNRVSFKRWVEMDLYYIDNWSLWLDLKLIVHTVRVVLRGTGM